MKPKWQKLASLAQEICALKFQFFNAVFASKGYPQGSEKETDLLVFTVPFVLQYRSPDMKVSRKGFITHVPNANGPQNKAEIASLFKAKSPVTMTQVEKLFSAFLDI